MDVLCRKNVANLVFCPMDRKLFHLYLYGVLSIENFPGLCTLSSIVANGRSIFIIYFIMHLFRFWGPLKFLPTSNGIKV